MKSKTAYRIRNWPQYNAALRARGSLTLWVDEEALRAWRYTGPRQRGAQYVYADAAIKCVLTLRAVYHLALRATEGLARSVFALIEAVELLPPDPLPQQGQESAAIIAQNLIELGVSAGTWFARSSFLCAPVVGRLGRTRSPMFRMLMHPLVFRQSTKKYKRQNGTVTDFRIGASIMLRRFFLHNYRMELG